MNAWYGLFGMNQRLFEGLNGTHAPWLDALMVLGTRLGDAVTLSGLPLAAASMLLIRHVAPEAALTRRLPRREQILRFLKNLLAAALSTASVVSLLKWGLDLPRPLAALPEGTVRVLVPPGSSPSFPSGHAALAMMTACVLWPHCRRLGRSALVAGVGWVSVSRIGVGAHFPADVLAGLLCGALCAGLSMACLTRRPQPGSSQ